MNGPPLTGILAVDVGAQLALGAPDDGWGTKTWRVVGMPLARATDRARRAKTCVCTATVGTP